MLSHVHLLIVCLKIGYRGNWLLLNLLMPQQMPQQMPQHEITVTLRQRRFTLRHKSFGNILMNPTYMYNSQPVDLCFVQPVHGSPMYSGVITPEYIVDPWEATQSQDPWFEQDNLGLPQAILVATTIALQLWWHWMYTEEWVGFVWSCTCQLILQMVGDYFIGTSSVLKSMSSCTAHPQCNDQIVIWLNPIEGLQINIQFVWH